MMRQGHNPRRSRGRHNGGGHSYNGGGSGGNNGGGNNGGRGRVHSRTQSFDSNGPDVRIRGNAFQVNEKYMTLARDAASAGDRVLAESYFQHAEHYQRILNEVSAYEAEQGIHHNNAQQSSSNGANHHADGDGNTNGNGGADEESLTDVRFLGAGRQPQPSTSGNGDDGQQPSLSQQPEEQREGGNHRSSHRNSRETERV